MSHHIDSITDAYRCLLKGLSPKEDTRALATKLCAGICGFIPAGERDSCNLCRSINYPDGFHYNTVELTCVTLTLVEKIISILMSQGMSAETNMYFMEILRLLFQEMDFMSKLVDTLKAEDRFIAHLAAKRVISTYVFYELKNSGTVSPIWQQKCVQAFQNAGPCNELDACIWSFTSVLKKTLKVSIDCKTEMLEQLLEAFDPHLSGLYSKFLPEGRECRSQSADLFTGVGDRATAFSSLLDLLEVLTATRFVPRSGTCLQSQRLTHAHAAALLRAAASTPKYFVKKQILLVLKRTLLQKAGEDMALGPGPSALRDEHFRADTTMLSDIVLQAVGAGWLQCVPVEAAHSFLGGTGSVCSGAGQHCDYVMLRAVSLVVLKSLEVRSQSATGATGATVGVDSAVEAQLHPYLQALLGFLRQRGVPLEECSHPCSWLSLVFAEQDDDMMEAAKVLLALALHHSQSAGGRGAAVSEAACAAGANPHCHFLFLLQSVSFDHSILLDFLISTETCFLEYFVRYLKLLLATWECFTLACQRLEEWLNCSIVEPVSRRGASPLVYKDELGPVLIPDWARSGLCAQPAECVQSVGGAVLASGLGLVDYDSSEGSEAEETSDSSGSKVNREEDLRPRAAVCGEGSLRAAGVNQEARRMPASVGNLQTEHQPPDASPSTKTGPGPGGTSTLCCVGETHSGKMSVPQAQPVGRTSGGKTVLCLSVLREVITRLHFKKLFPYNPSSLLKLLVQVEAVSYSRHQYPSQ